MEIKFGNNLQSDLERLEQERQDLIQAQVDLSRKIAVKRDEIRNDEVRKREEKEAKAREAERLRLEALEQEKTKEIQQIIQQIIDFNLESWEKSRDYQKEDIVEMFRAFEQGESGFFNANDMGLGKMQPLYSKILTPNGWTTMGELSVGSIITSSNGDATTVEAIYPHGIKDIYRMHFSDGTYVDSGLEHLWEVRNSNDKRRGNKRVLTTEQIMNDLKVTLGGRNYNKWFVPTVAPVHFNPSKPMPINSYVLGALLGDGSFRGDNVHFTSADWEVADRVDELLIDTLNQNTEIEYGVTGTYTREVLKTLGLWGHKSETKFIPGIYKTASLNDRLELVRGLMDTDGTIQDNCMSYSSSSKQLAYDFADLVRGLGGIAWIKPKKTSHLLNYNVFFKWGQSEEPPFYLKRKLAKMSPSQYYCDKSISKVEYVGAFEAQCIQVEAKDSLYVTDGYTLTHNTFETIIVLSLIFKKFPEYQCLWLTKSSILNTGGTKREINTWAPDLKVIEISGSTPADQREFMVDLVASMPGVILLTNYETIRTTKSLQESSFEILVMDEVHKLKGGANPSGPVQLWKDVKEYVWTEDFTLRVKYMMMLSGTPMVNRVAELWAYLHIFDPVSFDSLRDFERTFNAYIEFGGKIDVDKILDLCLKNRMVRRTRTEVGIQLPSITDEYTLIEYTPRQQKVYDEMKEKFFIWLDDQKESALTATAIITQLIRLRQISVWPCFSQETEHGTVSVNIEESGKIDEAMQIIEDANDQVVVFCNFNNPFDEIKKRCRQLGLSCEIISGETSKNMGAYEIGFQKGEIDVLCINSSMGEGLNLQKNPSRWKGGASVGILLDAWWNPARDDQCIARIWRQGSDIPVFIYRIHAPNSVDDYVKAISDEKGETFGEIMSDSRIRPNLKEELRELL